MSRKDRAYVSACFLVSFRNSAHERRMVEIIADEAPLYAKWRRGSTPFGVLMDGLENVSLGACNLKSQMARAIQGGTWNLVLRTEKHSEILLMLFVKI